MVKFGALLICLTCAALAQTTPQQVGASYVIGPGDKLCVTGNVLFIPRCFRPDAKGMIYMPLLKHVKAAGLTPMQFAASIQKKFEKKHIKSPYLEVVVIDIHGQFRDSAQTSTVYERLRQQPHRAPTLLDSPDFTGIAR